MKPKIFTILELQAIRVVDNGEKLLNAADERLLCDYGRLDSGIKSIIVRESVIGRLQTVQKRLEQYSRKVLPHSTENGGIFLMETVSGLPFMG